MMSGAESRLHKLNWVYCSSGMLTMVFVHRDGKWRIAEGHNTIIDPQAAAHDPGK